MSSIENSKTGSGGRRNPAVGFLIMAAFNAVAAILFFAGYLFFRDDLGENSIYFLIAAIAMAAGTVGLIIAYRWFSNKLRNGT